VNRRYAKLLEELREVRDAITDEAERLNIAIAGGGAHPFHQWQERRIFASERFLHVSTLYGYLAKQFTVFGQHIHIGVESGDDGVYLTHALAPYMPHFIALSASSPFSLGADTQFDSSRLNVVNAFPLAGIMPAVGDWEDFERYFETMRGYGIVESMKDFYWDIRPKPEYGTVEIRVCDTPLTVTRAAQLAVYAQALSAALTEDRSWRPDAQLALVYSYNRFQACRFGFAATIVDPTTHQHGPLAEEIAATIGRVLPYAERTGSAAALGGLLQAAMARTNDARALRDVLERRGALTDVVRFACAEWRGS
jgi:carboxylate-amine ligase